MKIPEKAPDWRSFWDDNPDALLELPGLIAPMIARANKEYLYWDRFKHKSQPDGIKPEAAWASLKLSRWLREVKALALQDLTGKNFTYWLPDHAHNSLHFIDQNSGGQILVDEQVDLSEERQRYILKSIMEEAITSSQLEGAATTRVVAKEMLRSGRQPADHAERMIFNNYVTITRIRDHLGKRLTPELLFEFHRLISKNTLEDASQEGRFRTEKDGDIQVYDENDHVLHIPPAPHLIKSSVEQLCDFANAEDGEEFVHPVIRGILLHFWLAYLHPFVDGNGRTARALFYWFMLKKKYWLFEYLSISRIIRKASAQYYRSFLYSEIDDRDMTYFIMFHLRTIRLAIEELRVYLARKQEESRKAIQLLKKQPYLNHRQRSLLMNALERPTNVYTFNTHMKTHGVVYQTARADLMDLREHGLLQMHKVGRKFRFTPAPNLKDMLT